MNCNEARRFIEANADGELELTPHLELEDHLRTCAECAARARNAAVRRVSLRENLPRFTAPPELAAKIRSALGHATDGSVPKKPARARVIHFGPLGRVTSLAAAVALSAFVGYRQGDIHARTTLLTDEIVSAHVRSLQASHLMDVASTDQHTVKPWFAGKLDFSPPVVDLAEIGFPLSGGRLEHIDGRSAAALVYHRRQHAINLLIWPAGEATNTTPKQTGRDGFQTESWTSNGFRFVAISEIPTADLAEFSQQFRSRVSQ